MSHNPEVDGRQGEPAAQIEGEDHPVLAAADSVRIVKCARAVCGRAESGQRNSARRRGAASGSSYDLAERS